MINETEKRTPFQPTNHPSSIHHQYMIYIEREEMVRRIEDQNDTIKNYFKF